MKWDHVGSLLLTVVYEAFHKPASHWLPYFAMLPATFPGMYICMDVCYRCVVSCMGAVAVQGTQTTSPPRRRLSSCSP